MNTKQVVKDLERVMENYEDEKTKYAIQNAIGEISELKLRLGKALKKCKSLEIKVRGLEEEIANYQDEMEERYEWEREQLFI